MYNEKITPNFFKEVFEEIAKWKKVIQNDQDNGILYELAFFKIYLKFEKEYVRSFIAILSNPHLYKEVRINYRVLPLFSEAEKNETNPFEKFLRSIGGHSYYLSINKISDLHKEFMLEPNPFSEIHGAANLSSALTEMTIIRNFFAHESQDARKKYMTHFHFTEQNIQSASNLLKSKMKKEDKTRFTHYINTITTILDIIRNNTRSEK